MTTPFPTVRSHLSRPVNPSEGTRTDNSQAMPMPGAFLYPENARARAPHSCFPEVLSLAGHASANQEQELTLFPSSGF